MGIETLFYQLIAPVGFGGLIGFLAVSILAQLFRLGGLKKLMPTDVIRVGPRLGDEGKAGGYIVPSGLSSSLFEMIKAHS